MPVLQFKEDTAVSTRRKEMIPGTSFARKLIKWGIVKNEKQANLILICIVALALGVTVFNVLSVTRTTVTPTTMPTE